MLFTISGKHIEITEAIKIYAEKKTSKLPRYYNSINQIEVIIAGDWAFARTAYRNRRPRRSRPWRISPSSI